MAMVMGLVVVMRLVVVGQAAGAGDRAVVTNGVAFRNGSIQIDQKR